MNGDLGQKRDHSESRPQPENKLESIWDITRAIKDGDEKYAERLGILADLLSETNANLVDMISIETSVNNHLRKIRAGITVLVERTK